MKHTFGDFGLPAEPGTEAFWAAFSGPVSLPADDGWATLFLWRGSPAVLAFESGSDPVPLTRWGDTDCWYAELAMPARLRLTYQFRADDGAYADPFNPAGAGPDRSVTATPDVLPSPYWPVLGPDDVLPLPRTRIRWTSPLLGARRTVRVHPVGGGGPVVLLLDGDDWLHLHPAMAAFDAAGTAGALPPATLVFVPAKDRAAEFCANRVFWQAVRDELLPLVAAGDTPADLGRLVVAGQSLGGLSALYAALEFPGLISGIACQSGAFWWTPEAVSSPDPLSGPAGGAIAARLRAERPDLTGLRIGFDVGEHEQPMHRHCAEVESLAAQAGAVVRSTRSPGGHDRAAWRTPLLDHTAWLLG
ncbi:alpha/beta hydrolase-fold protein [Actinocorallia aurea]